VFIHEECTNFFIEKTVSVTLESKGGNRNGEILLNFVNPVFISQRTQLQEFSGGSKDRGGKKG